MAEAAALDEADPFYARQHPAAFMPPAVPFGLRPGDRLLLIGDSITEANRHSRMLETYLRLCRPDLGVEVRNIGKGGETAEGFLGRMEGACLRHRPTVATVCYGMNDAGYRDKNLEAAKGYGAAMRSIVHGLKGAGVRVVLAAPGCIGRLPPWEFIHEAGGSMEGINASLSLIRDEAAAIAAEEGLPFVDHFWNLYRTGLEARGRYGAEYAVCGADDGVHPSWAGHVVMAFGLFEALGFDGDLGSFTVDLESRHAAAAGPHDFVGHHGKSPVFSSRIHPYCAEGALDRDCSIRSGMSLLPFNQRFNRLILKVRGATAARYRLAWMNESRMLDEWRVFTRPELEAGINLADSFELTPFSASFHRMDDLVSRKQEIESAITWGQEGLLQASAEAEEREAERSRIMDRMSLAFRPVTHSIHLEALG